METNAAIDGALQTLTGLLNAFTNPGNREMFRRRAVEFLEQNELPPSVTPGSDGQPPEYPTTDLSKTIHEGLLLKKGDWRWHKRYCLLDGLYFRIFNEKGEIKPKYVIPLIRLTQVRRDAHNRFIVTPFPEDGPPVVFEAEPAQVSEWLLAFQRAREICFPDEPAPTTKQRKSQQDAWDLHCRFEELVTAMPKKTTITGLGAMTLKDGPSLAEATVMTTHNQSDSQAVSAILVPPSGDHKDCCAVMGFRFPADASVLKLNLDVSSVEAQPPPALVMTNSTKTEASLLTPDDKDFLSMDHQWAGTPRTPKTKLEMETNVLIQEKPDLVSQEFNTPAAQNGSSAEAGNLTKKEAKALLAELRISRKAGDMTEDEYKDAKRALLGRLAGDGADNADEGGVVNM
eukprot:TRINITY_DN28523_c0_g1_i1.p1 TRINITY_DN28523_c0_g1~~TRINITY_DN28523_c0_g1_i1.p1  ORF type:complete len:400 (+),score=90.51 TRINITY_DN28523_c0_g1_i1:193-1392(+)